jgi:hypothetical protein
MLDLSNDSSKHLIPEDFPRSGKPLSTDSGSPVSPHRACVEMASAVMPFEAFTESIAPEGGIYDENGVRQNG